jgi:hypothetical protein
MEERSIAAPLNMESEVITAKSEEYMEQPAVSQMAAEEIPGEKDGYDDALSVSTMSKNNSYSTVIIGTVLDETGMPMVGVNVKAKGEKTGTVTNSDGEYKIEVTDRDSELEFTYIGYLKEEIAVGNQDKIDFKMTPEQLALEEVVVVGYGTQKKSDMTGSVSSVNSEDKTQNNKQNNEQALQGKAAGVTVTRQNKQQNPVAEELTSSDCNNTPYPDGGFEKFETYLASNTILPEDAEKGKEYSIVLTLTITENGLVKNIKTKESPGSDYSNEAIRLINQGPSWVPAHDKNCNPISFTMDYTMKLTGKKD